MISNSFATWELFLDEITRNITPRKEEIQNSFQFLLEKQACSEKRYEAMVAVRYMAAFEQAINEYLHPPKDFKQANIKAEIIHFGSLFESLSEILLIYLYKNNRFSLDNYKEWFPKPKTIGLNIVNEEIKKKTESDKGKIKLLSFSFNHIIETLSHYNKQFICKADNNLCNEMKEFLKTIDSLRKERNSVHVTAMVKKDIFLEEYKLVEIREKWERFLQVIKKLILN